uniref:Uncharacterized protein n=1 Tax=Parascaris equorum TaxID=6256 RepID=A0A914RH70_PAREQ
MWWWCIDTNCGTRSCTAVCSFLNQIRHVITSS